MPMGTLQLIFVGPQNLFITENPQITFFKAVYKRHTNFAIDTIQEFFDGTMDFGNRIKCKLGKNGDLLGRMGMYIRLSDLNKCTRRQDCHQKNNCLCTCYKCLIEKKEEPLVYGWTNAIGHVLLEWIEMYIGGQLIDRHYGEWLEIWAELAQTAEKRLGYYEMIGKKDPLSYTVDSFTGDMELYVPFAFWFCRNIGLAIPVLCLYYHDIEFVVKLRDFNQCWVCNKCDPPLPPKAKIEACILAEYIYLSLEERHKFYTESHLYLIEQVQLNQNNHSDYNIGNFNIQMDFNHPVKELIWILQRQDVVGPPNGVWPEDCSYPRGNDHFNFTASRIPRFAKQMETFSYAKIILSGVDRTVYWPASFYRLWKNYFYHTRIPTANNIYVYPFGFTPEEHQPSGECNMSRVDNAQLVLRLFKKYNACEIYPVHARIYATNYNILFITGGMGGVMFEN